MLARRMTHRATLQKESFADAATILVRRVVGRRCYGRPRNALACSDDDRGGEQDEWSDARRAMSRQQESM
jgi:hypothetical protein